MLRYLSSHAGEVRTGREWELVGRSVCVETIGPAREAIGCKTEFGFRHVHREPTGTSPIVEERFEFVGVAPFFAEPGEKGGFGPDAPGTAEGEAVEGEAEVELALAADGEAETAVAEGLADAEEQTLIVDRIVHLILTTENTENTEIKRLPILW